jgi:hypothetical protein
VIILPWHWTTGNYSAILIGVMDDPKVTAQIPSSLVERARTALDLGAELPAIAIVRKALINAIGDDAMSYEVPLGRRPSKHTL